ncbi:hypothetical protein [Campylobacter sp.]|uniref:hypothetical protein n=1 Tax=Campylobacter sp. TaxID=205 RepID=UPI0027BA069A|nr:hypothetical protein [Campylobacter sp.]
MRGHISRRGGAAPQHRIALLAHKPHLTPDDALSGADYVRAVFSIAAAPHEIYYEVPPKF